MNGLTPETRVDTLPDVCPRCGQEEMFKDEHWHWYKLQPTAPCYGCGLCGCVIYTLREVSLAAKGFLTPLYLASRGEWLHRGA